MADVLQFKARQCSGAVACETMRGLPFCGAFVSFSEVANKRSIPQPLIKLLSASSFRALRKTQSDVNVDLCAFQLVTPLHIAKHKPLCART